MDLEAQNAPTTEVAQSEAPESAAPQVADIDGFSEFTFQGKSYTPEDLAKVFGEHEQFKSRVEQYSENDKYLDNLLIDIESVLQDPRLASQFKATYPKRFHAFLDRELNKQSGSQDASQAQSTQEIPKELVSKISALEGKLSRYERMAHEADVEKQDAILQKTVDPLFAKYDMADQDAVWAKAQALVEQGYQMTPAAWERLIKANHDAIEKRVTAKHQAKLKTQMEKGQKAQDTGAGGSAPGQAPKKAKTIAEATEDLLAHLSR